MKRYLHDSNAISVLSGKNEPLYSRAQAAIHRGDRLGTCEPVIAELYYGLEFSSSREINSLRIGRTLSQLTSWPFERSAARQCALVMADLKRRGLPIQMIDMLLAAVALSLGNTTVVTMDSDLLRISGLSVENWAETA